MGVKPMVEKPMTYEEFLDEVSTLLTEIYTLEDQVAIDIVMRAQADDFFTGHDDDTSICTLERADQDARTVFKQYKLTGNHHPKPLRH